MEGRGPGSVVLSKEKRIREIGLEPKNPAEDSESPEEALPQGQELVKRHKLHGRGVRRFPPQVVFSEKGLLCLGAAKCAGRLRMP